MFTPSKIAREQQELRAVEAGEDVMVGGIPGPGHARAVSEALGIDMVGATPIGISAGLARGGMGAVLGGAAGALAGEDIVGSAVSGALLMAGGPMVIRQLKNMNFRLGEAGSVPVGGMAEEALETAYKSDPKVFGAVLLHEGGPRMGKRKWEAAMVDQFGETENLGKVRKQAATFYKKRLNDVLHKRNAPMAKIEEMFEMANSGRASVGNWYDGFREQVFKMFGKEDGTQFIRFLSATSAGSKASVDNIGQAKKAYMQWKLGLDMYAGRFGASPALLDAAKGVDDFGDRKMQQYFKAMMGDEDAVVIDVWMSRIFGWGDVVPGKRAYAFAEETVRKLAKEMGVAPRDMQGHMWSGIKKSWEDLGKTTKDVAEPYRTTLARTLEADPEFMKFVNGNRKDLDALLGSVGKGRAPEMQAQWIRMTVKSLTEGGMVPREIMHGLLGLSLGGAAGAAASPEDRFGGALAGAVAGGLAPTAARSFARGVPGDVSDVRGALDELPMDEASRMARAAEQDYTEDVFHSTRRSGGPEEQLSASEMGEDFEEFYGWTHVGTEKAARDRGDQVRGQGRGESWISSEEVWSYEIFDTRLGGHVKTVPTEFEAREFIKANDLAPGFPSLDYDKVPTASFNIVPDIGERTFKLKMRGNYLEVSEGYGWQPGDILRQAEELGAITHAEKIGTGHNRDAVTELLESKGFDGVKYINDVEDPGSMSYMVFDPANLRSATAAKFDPANIGKPSMVGGTPIGAARALVGAGLGATGGAAVEAETTPERLFNIAAGTVAGVAVVGGAQAAISKFTGRGLANKVTGEAQEFIDSSPSAQHVAEKVVSLRKDTGPLVPDKKEFMTFVERQRYALVRRELPLEKLDQIAERGTLLRDALGDGRGEMGAADQHLEDFIGPLLQRTDESSRVLGTLWATAHRGLEMAQWGKKTSPEDMAAFHGTIDDLAKSKHAGVAELAANELMGEYKRLLDELLREGVINDNAYKALTRKGQYYVPYKPAVFDQIEAWSGRGGTGNIYRPNDSSGLEALSKDINEEVIVDPYEELIQSVFEVKQRVARQRIANIIAGHVETGKLEGLIEVSSPAKYVKGRLDSDVIKVIVDGKPKHYRILNEDISNAWSSFNSEMQRGALLRTANSMRKVMQAGVTMPPQFGMTNALRDFVMSSIQYELAEGVPLLGAAVRKFGQGRSLATTTTLGATVGAATAEEGERGAGALRGAIVGAGALGAPHVIAHIGRTMSAMNDIMGPDAMAMVAGGMYGYTTGDESATLGENMLRFGAGAFVGRGAGKLVAKAGFGGQREQYKQYLREGGGQFGLYRKRGKKDPAQMLEEIERLGVSDKDILDPEGWGHAIQLIMSPIQALASVERTVKNAPRRAFEMLSAANRAIETAPRLAFHKRNLERAGIGLADRAREFVEPEVREAVSKSIFEARDLSLDFAVRGASTTVGMATSVTPFLNPTLLGMDKLVRLLGNKSTVEVSAATILAPTMALWLVNHLDAETAQAYDDRPDYEKNTYWLIPKKYVPWNDETEGFYRVPKPFEIGHIFGSIPERIMDSYYKADNVKATAKIGAMFGGLGDGLWGMKGAFMAVPSPVVIGPSIQAGLSGEHGYDWFRGRSIDPYPWRNVESIDQQTPYTSTLAVAIARAPYLGKGLASLGFNTPAKVDFAIASYLGPAATEAVQMSSGYLRRKGIDPRPEPVGNRRAFESRFHTRPTTSTQPELDFRQSFDEVEEAWNSFNDLINNKDFDEADRRFGVGTEGDDRIAQYYVMRSFKNDIDEWTSLRRQIRDEPALPVEEREAIVVEINQTMSGIARKSEKLVRDIMEQRAAERRDGER
jgi:hypothetical protein